MFELFRIGCNTMHSSAFKVDRPKGYDWYLLLLVKTPATFFIEGVEQDVPANTLILYDRNHPHNYMARSGNYKNDWLHFECHDSAYAFMDLPMNQPILLSNHYYLSDLIEKLAAEFYSNNPCKNTSIDLLMQLLFIKAKEEQQSVITIPHQNHLINELVQLRKDIFSNPQTDWSIKLMSERLNISCGYLQNLYKETFSASCMTEVIESRINRAKELLAGTNLQVYEISSLCGYKNEVHFMRQFKKLTEKTPSGYRKNF